MPRKLTTAQFIEKAKAEHGDKYSYEHTNYVNTSTKLTITCPVHGDFRQTPNNHLQGNGCPSCGRKALQTTTAQFIEKAKAVHGDKYTYEHAVYTASMQKLTITCPLHGDFLQPPNRHLQGNGCPACAGVAIPTTAQFIEKARTVHGDRYTYEHAVYTNVKQKLTITCPKHGDFLQTPNAHLRGRGCPRCGDNALQTTAQFIEKAKAEHGDKYSYDRVEYANNSTKVEIVCPKHGSFWQSPNNHIAGHGCPACGSKALCENIVGEVLRKHYPDVITQYPIRGSEFNMRADFYIPSRDTIVEWNGIQHYQPVALWGGAEAFERQQLRDADLRAYCEKTCMKLCVIDARPFTPVRNPPTEDVILAAIQEAQQ